MIKLPGIPYLIYGAVTEGGAAVPTARVKIRNETTNQTATVTADSGGLYLYSLDNITGGYTDGDQITVYTIYSNFEGTETFTIDLSTAYFTEQDLALTVIADSTTVYYCTVQDVYDELDAKTASDISATRIVNAIQRAEGLIDVTTGTFFKEETITDEVHTADRYSLDLAPDQLDSVASMSTLRRDSWGGATLNRVKTKYKPIVSISSLSVNQAGYNSADSWSALTEQTGSSGDFYLEDSDAGVIDFITNFPRIGKRSWKITYVAGYDRDSTDRTVISLLRVVERLTILLASKAIITTKTTGALFDSTRDIKIGEIELKGGAMSSSQYLTSITPEIQGLWKEIGDNGIEVI